MRVDEVPYCFGESGPTAVFVRPAGRCGNTVHVTADVLFGRLGPLQSQIEAQTVLLLELECGVVNGLGAAFGNDFPEVREQAVTMLKRVSRLLAFVLKRDLDPFVDVAGDLEPLADDRGVELDFRKYRRIRMEEDLGATPAGRPDFLRCTERLPLLDRKSVV